MVPIKEAISSGFWMHCEYQGYNELIKFRLKINSFRKIKLSEIDNPEEMKSYDSNSILWLAEIEVINLTKNPIHPNSGPKQLFLVDKEGFYFPMFDDNHLRLFSEFSEKYKLNRFFINELVPKIKAVGSIAFQLPDDDDAEYSIALKKDGIVQEI